MTFPPGFAPPLRANSTRENTSFGYSAPSLPTGTRNLLQRFSLFWMAGASGFQIPDFSEGWGFFPLFGLPFVVIGVGLMTSPLRTYRSTQRSVCAITNQRALLIEVSGKKTSVKSFFPDRLAQGHIYREDKTNGLSDVMFASETTTDSDGDAKTCPLGFENIPDGRTAETLLHELARVQRCAA